jgi:hypothetical protein
MPHWLSRSVIGIIGFVAAMLASALAFLAFIFQPEQLASIPGELFDDKLGKMGAFYLATAGQFAKFSAPFVLIAAILGEMKSYRSWVYYTLCGAVLALLGYTIWQESRIAPPTSEDLNVLAYAAFAVAGAIGGLVYWLIAGRTAGASPFIDQKIKQPTKTPPSTSKPASGSGKPTSNGKNKTAQMKS